METIQEVHRLLWPGGKPNYLAPMKSREFSEAQTYFYGRCYLTLLCFSFLFLKNNARLQDCPQVFTEKTLPTSVLVATFAWQMMNNRANNTVRAQTWMALDGLLRLCAVSGKFDVTIRPEIHPGPLPLP